MGRDDVEPGARQGVPGDNWKLNTRRTLTGGVLIADAGGAMAGGGAMTSAGATSGQAAARFTEDMWSRTRRPLTLAAVGTAALVVPIAFDATAANAPTLHAALETMMTLFAFAAAWLLRAPFVSSRRGCDLLLVCAALVLGLLTFAAGALPSVANLDSGTYIAGAELWGRLFVGAVFAAAAFAPSQWLIARRRHALGITAGLSLAAVAIAGLGGLLIGRHGSVATFAGDIDHPVALALVIGATGLLVYAAAGFARRQRVEDDPVAGLLAFAMVLIGGASFAHLVRGSLVLARIDASEGVCAVAFGLILVAAVVGDRQVHVRLAKASALAERRRVARDLHDGIAQDLAFIAAHGPRFAEELGDDHPLVIAAKRALAVSRSTISDLSDPEGASAHESLEGLAHELRHRFDIAIAVDTHLDGDLEAGTREHVTRIAREAIANAARHGKATSVIVSLRHTDSGVALRVLDDGCGIGGGASGATSEGFGLRSMRDRAAALGGQLSVRCPQSGGTDLEVILP